MTNYYFIILINGFKKILNYYSTIFLTWSKIIVNYYLAIFINFIYRVSKLFILI